MFTEASNAATSSGWFPSAVAPKANPVPEIAAKAVMSTEGDTSKAAQQLLKDLRRQHREFYKEKSAEVMLYWAQDQIRHARSRLRNQIANAPKGASPEQRQGLNAESVRQATAAWFNWPVLPGVSLGEANRTQLAEAAESYLANSETYRKRGSWLRAIAEAMPSDETKVSEVLNDAAVGEMAAKFGVSAS